MDSEANDYQNSQMAAAGQKESDNNNGLAEPNVLPPETYDQTKERARLLFHAYGRAPFGPEKLFNLENASPTPEQLAAARVVSEFVYYWQPYFSERGKEDGSSS